MSLRGCVFACLVVACGEPLVVQPLTEPTPPTPTEVAPAAAVPRPEPAPAPRAPEPPRGPTEEEIAEARAEAAREAFEAAFPNHGVSFHFLARVRARPHHEAAVVGYMRRGANFRASERVPGVGCARGWFEVPGEGYVCRGEGFLIGAEPQVFEPSPSPPALEDPLPHRYVSTARADVPQYCRLPTPGEHPTANDTFPSMRSAQAERLLRLAAPPPRHAVGDAGADADDVTAHF